jgi:hypothetical protein
MSSARPLDLWLWIPGSRFARPGMTAQEIRRQSRWDISRCHTALNLTPD